jgi:hypothetical protein
MSAHARVNSHLACKVSHIVAHENCTNTAPTLQNALQKQAGYAAAVPTITLHVTGLSHPDALKMSVTTAAASLNNCASSKLLAGTLPQSPYPPYTLTYLLLLLSGCILVPDLCRFKPKLMIEWTSWKRACN